MTDPASIYKAREGVYLLVPLHAAFAKQEEKEEQRKNDVQPRVRDSARPVIARDAAHVESFAAAAAVAPLSALVISWPLD